MTRYLIVLTLTLLVGYGALELRPLLLGPSLSIHSPQNNSAVSYGIVAISGVVRRATALTVNGAPVLPDQNGSFTTTLTLPRGAAVLTLSAGDRFGRSITQTRTVFVPN